MTKQELQHHFNEIIRLGGKKRFKKLYYIMEINPNITPINLRHEYFKLSDHYQEDDILTDRLSNKGFNRNAPQIIDLFIEYAHKVITNLKKIK